MNFRQLPKLTYSGLTVVLRNPSRFDIKIGRLLSANGGSLFSEYLAPEFNIHQCDLRVKEDREPLLPGTKAVLLLGEEAAQDWLSNKENTLNEIRGSVYRINDIPHIATFFPQDCTDIKDYESTHNTGYETEEAEDDKAPVDEKRRHGKTKRKNFRFWLDKDIQKVKLILKNKIPENPIPNPEYVIYPSSDTVIKVLSETRDRLLFFDIETDEKLNILCFSFSFDCGSVYCVPCLDYMYRWAYHNLPHIYRALAIAIWNNTVVAHNGANFDFYVLGRKYKIAINRVKDTMLQQHRCFPEAEKSLGHCLPLNGLIDTVSGRFQIKDLLDKKDFYVWSWKNNNPFPSKVKRVFKTRENAELCRVKCWRKIQSFIEEFEIVCTPDHLFLLNGKWIEAKNLKPADSLTRVKIHYGKSYNQYDRIVYLVNGKEVRERVHKYIYEILNSKTDLHIHHKNENKWNNEPSNLEALTPKQHYGKKHLNQIKNIDKSTLHGYYKDLKIKDYLILEKVELESLYNSGMSFADIAKLKNTTYTAISRIFKSYNLIKRSHSDSIKLTFKSKHNCRVISVEPLKERQDVYCLEVEGTNCFSSNGVIIHNCTALWSFEPFHKDEGDGGYNTSEQVRKKLLYCGKDVYTMMLIYRAQIEHARRNPGLQESFDQVNSAIRPYLITTFTGIHYDAQMVRDILKENDALMMQYIRILNWFVGEKTISELRKRFKSSLPGSNPQCCIYFHEKLCYPVVGRGSEKKDGTRNPSLAKKNLYKLKLKHENPVIDLIIAYRGTQKESGSLKFNPLEI